jgi:hypothetical protein
MRETTLKLRVCWVASLLVFAVVVAILTGATTAYAQQGAGVLTGSVINAQDKSPLTDVVVTATSPDLQGEQVVVTDASGFFRIPDLPSGTYSVKYEKDGFKPLTRDGVALRTDATIRVNAELLPTTVTAEEVVVVAKAPTIDVGSSTVGSNITKDFTSRIPVAPPTTKGGANKSIESVAEVVPGAKSDTYGVSFAGSSSPENTYLVDGLNVGNPGLGVIGTPLSTEFVKEVNVITGGYMPEYGRTTGGSVSAITKSGSNEFHGGVWGDYAPGGLAGTPKVPPVGVGSVSSTQPLSYSGSLGADVGGPIVKDKVWFYVGFDYSTENYDVNRFFYRQTPTNANLAQALNPNCGTPGNPPCPNVEQMPQFNQKYTAVAQTFQALGKLTFAINPDNKITATFTASPTTTGGAGKFSIDPRAGGPQLGGFPLGTYDSSAIQANTQAYDASVKWSTEFANKRVLIDTTAGYHYEQDDALPNDGTLVGSGQGLSNIANVSWDKGPPYHAVNEFENIPGLAAQCAVPAGVGPMGLNTLCPVPSYASGGPLGPESHLFRQIYARYSIGSTLTYLLQAAGHHVIKAGFSVEYTTMDELYGHSGQGVMSESTDGTQINENEAFGVLNGPDNALKVDPLHVKTHSIIAGGFLQDSWSIMDVITANFGVRYDAQTLYNSEGQAALSFPNEWSPRVGLIYDPTQQGRAKIFANYARYYENIPLALANDSLVGQPSVLADHNVTNPNAAATIPPSGCPANGSGNCVVGGGNTPPQSPSQTWHAFGGGSDPLDPAVQPTTEDDFVAGGEYEIIKDARLGISYQRRWMVRWLDDMSRDATNSFFLGNPGYGWASDFPQATRVYDAGTLYFMKAFADDWLTSASWTISYLRGNIGGLYRTSNGELDPNHNADFDTKAFTINTNGPLDGDQTHQIKLFGAKDWAINPQNRVMTGLSLRATSGLPMNYFAGDFIYGTGSDFNLLLPRGSGGRTPWTYDVDASVGYRFQIDKDKSIGVTMDIFNLLNFQEVTSYNELYTQGAGMGKQNGTLRDAVIIDTSSGAVRQLNKNDLNPNFGLPQSYQNPRYFRFGLRGTF